uniref:IGFBP N-terminal domain-containing protein n=1 Tax=Onchocerca volvulus TaxID=6282 RepID=A0A8R1TMI0_ONCVO
MNIRQFYQFHIIIHLFFTTSTVFLSQQLQIVIATFDTNDTDYYQQQHLTDNLFILDNLSTVCSADCPNFCPNPDSLNCSELAPDPCECCTVCVHKTGELCGPGIGTCHAPNFCQPKLDENSIGICSGKLI